MTKLCVKCNLSFLANSNLKRSRRPVIGPICICDGFCLFRGKYRKTRATNFRENETFCSNRSDFKETDFLPSRKNLPVHSIALLALITIDFNQPLFAALIIKKKIQFQHVSVYCLPKHCGQRFLGKKCLYIHIRSVFCTLKVEVQHNRGCNNDTATPLSYKIGACKIFVKNFSVKNKKIFEFGDFVL